MKYKKKLLILCLIICTLFTISSVCASDLDEMDLDDELASADEIQVIEENSNEEIISEGNYGTFAELNENIKNTPVNSTLTLENDYINTDGFSKWGIKINKTITIDGKGHTIDGNHQSRAFQIENCAAILKNIKFINCKCTMDGGALDVSGWHGGILSNCTFINNSAEDENDCNGGAIYGSWSKYCTITNCTFINNTADRDVGGGGALCLYNFAHGYDYEHCTISNCYFIRFAT